MAKYECEIKGDFTMALHVINNEILKGSISASLEDSSDYNGEFFRLAVRVYERYSYFGGNRVSLNITVWEERGRVFLSAITAGGSQAVFFKFNTLGENSFLNKFVDSLRDYDLIR